MDKVRCLLIQSGLPKNFWAEATCTAAYLINRSSTAIEKKTPMEMWSGHPSDYEMLRIFGCVAYPHDKQGKLESRAIKCVLLGYPEGVKGYRLYRRDDESPKIVTSRNVVFNQSVMYRDTLKDSGAGDKSVEELQEDGDDEDAGDQETDQLPGLTDYQLVRDREPRTRMKHLRFQDESNLAAYAFVATEEKDNHESLTYQEAVAYEDSSKWKASIKEEMDSLRKNKTWELVDHPAGYKARLVARGFTQRESIDYNELEQLDVKMSFLHGNLEEVIYMKQPQGYEQGNKVCLLKKSLYGLKQSPRQWYKRFDEYMLSNGFKRSSYDSCVYYRSYAPGEYIYLLLYVDDILIACKSKAEIGSTKSLLKKEFNTKELEEAKKILGMEIVRDQSRKIMRVSQSGYVSKILNNFRIDNGKSVKMPLGGHFKLSLKDCPVRDCDVERMGKVSYENAIGRLIYLMVCTRPDIAYAVSVVSRYLANMGKNHWEAVKWILKYLRGTANVGLVYGTNHGNHVDVTGFVDSDYAKDPDKGRFITGYAFLVHGCIVSWKATLQHVVTLSTTEAEYMALTEAVKEAIWLRGLLVLEAKTVKVLKVGIKHNATDALTKVVPGLKLQHCLELLKVHVKELSADSPPILFKISNHYLHFGREEFCLVTGFRCGELSEYWCALDDEDAVRGEYMWHFFYKRTLNVVKIHLEKKDTKKMMTYNLNGFVWALKDSIPNVVLILTSGELKADWLVLSQYYFKGEDAPFIQSVKPKSIDFQRCECKDVDYVNDVEEDSTLVEQSKKPSYSTPVQATHLIEFRLEMKGMVDQLKSKVIDTLTSTFFYDVHKHAKVAESEVVNCETNLVERPLVQKDVGVFGVAVDICDMNLVDCLVVEKENSEQKQCSFTYTQPSSIEHLFNACAFVSPPLPIFDSPKAHKCVEPTKDTNDTSDDFMDNEDNPSQYCLDNMEIGIEEDSHNGELTISVYEELNFLCIRMSHDGNMNLDKLIADVTKYENKFLQMIKASKVNVVKGNGKPVLAEVYENIRRIKKPGIFKRYSYMQQRPTTPQVKKKRKRFNNLSPIEFSVTPPFEVDCSQQTLPPFKDFYFQVLRRHCKSNPRKVTVLTFMKSFLRNGVRPKQLYKFPWVNYGIVVDEHFWLTLLGLDENKSGWMLDDTSKGRLGHRWASFCPSILSGQMPLFYASNKRYPVTWSDVEKVYIQLNNPKTHWALGELELRTGVNTVYDFMTPRILKSKGLDVSVYIIKFQFSEKVPFQANVYGDCGV
ncbi:retrotransposon protein, putative, ty1-copia subclass [Tanacetum coccineum]